MEVEAKYALTEHVTADQIAALHWTPFRLGEQHTIDQRDTFFDTPDLALSRTRHAVRFREGGPTPVVTLKGPGTVQNGVHAREEIELPAADRDPRTWPAPIRERLLALIGDGALQPLLTVQNNRRTWALLRDGAPMGEVALDEGTIQAGEQREPMHELEIELKGGSEADLQIVSALVQRQLPARPEDRSKFARGLALIVGKQNV